MENVWSFNLNEVDENATEGFGLMPKGDYNMITVSSNYQKHQAHQC